MSTEKQEEPNEALRTVWKNHKSVSLAQIVQCSKTQPKSYLIKRESLTKFQKNVTHLGYYILQLLLLMGTSQILVILLSLNGHTSKSRSDFKPDVLRRAHG